LSPEIAATYFRWNATGTLGSSRLAIFLRGFEQTEGGFDAITMIINSYLKKLNILKECEDSSMPVGAITRGVGNAEGLFFSMSPVLAEGIPVGPVTCGVGNPEYIGELDPANPATGNWLGPVTLGVGKPLAITGVNFQNRGTGVATTPSMLGH
jgi:hypothetical protein